MPTACLKYPNKLEVELSKHAGELRYKYNLSIGYDPYNYCSTPEQKIANYQISYCAELMAAQLLNCYPDISFDCPHPEYDFRGPDGCTIDVKHTLYPNGRLMFGQHMDQRAEIYVLVTGDYSLMRVVGWVYRGELCCDEAWDADLDRPTWALAQSHLRPMMDLTGKWRRQRHDWPR